eukprot:scaffold316152_cov30-Tisochrysis_lutea.AAC.2
MKGHAARATAWDAALGPARTLKSPPMATGSGSVASGSRASGSRTKGVWRVSDGQRTVRAGLRLQT